MAISREILTAALAAFKVERQKIDANIGEVEALLGGKTKEGASEPPSKRGRGKRSAAARARMAQAQRDRWAKLKGESVAAPAASKTRRKMSAKASKGNRTGDQEAVGGKEGGGEEGLTPDTTLAINFHRIGQKIDLLYAARTSPFRCTTL